MTKQLVGIAAAVMTTFLVLALLWQFQIVVVYLIISLVVAAVLRPLVRRLAGQRLVTSVAWVLLYLAVLASVGFLLFIAAEAAINEIGQLAQTLAVRDVWRLPLWLEGSSFQQTLIGRLPAPSKIFDAVTGDQGQLVLPALLGFTQGMGSIVSAVLVILFLSLYWSINQVHFERLWLSLLPPDRRQRARDVWQTIETDVGAYIHSRIILSLTGGVLLGLGFWLIGSPYPALLALTGALASLIPVVGPILAVITVFLVGLQTSVQISVLTTIYALVVLLALMIWAKPRLFNRKWNNPILTVVLLLAMADAFGLIGIILAPALSIVCQILWNRLVSRRTVVGTAVQVSDLKRRYAAVRDALTAMDGPPQALATSSMERLNQLIEKAEPILQVGPSAAVQSTDLDESMQPTRTMAAEVGLPVSSIT